MKKSCFARILKSGPFGPSGHRPDFQTRSIDMVFAYVSSYTGSSSWPRGRFLILRFPRDLGKIATALGKGALAVALPNFNLPSRNRTSPFFA